MNYTAKDIGINANKVRKILINNGYQEMVSPILRCSDSAINPRFLVNGKNSYTGFLRDCMETPLRKCIGEATPKVFEIGPCFRQDEIDNTHQQEFYMMELYSANEELSIMKELTETIISDVIGVHIPSITISLVKAIWEDMEIDIRTASTEELISAISNKYSNLLGEHNYQIVNKYIDCLEKAICVKKDVIYFLEEYPICTIDSAERYDNTNTIKRFEAFFNKLEIAHAFVDCMDGVEIRTRAADSSIEDSETDELIRLTEQGYLLPTVGLGIGIDRLCMIQGGNCND
ncbi:MAG: hypothetical protein K2N34_04665 [Lachnospiraceae bacterium]|nr:hypothetical protein [Lachnospiraceae bacterium]